VGDADGYGRGINEGTGVAVVGLVVTLGDAVGRAVGSILNVGNTVGKNVGVVSS
jgi:hypothetical protein